MRRARALLRIPAGRLAIILGAVATTSCRPSESDLVIQAGPTSFEPSAVQILARSDTIAAVKDLEVLDDGSVWVLNSLSPYLVGFDPTGRVASVHGAAGGGPTEFQSPSAFVTGGINGEAWVFDDRRRALIRVSTPGQPWTVVSVPDAFPPGSLVGGGNMMDSPVRTARVGDEVVFARTNGSMASGIYSYRLAILAADLVALDLETGSARTIVSLAEALEDPSHGFELTDGGFPMWFRLWTVCGDRLLVYDRAGSALRWFNGDGSGGDSIPLPPHDLIEVSPQEFARVLYPFSSAEAAGAVGGRLSPEDSTRLMDAMVPQIRGDPTQLAAYLPRYVDLRCDENGVAWVRPFDIDRGGFEGSLTWLRVGRSGAVRRVTFPDRFDPLRFTSEKVWGAQRDEFDAASIAWIDLPGWDDTSPGGPP